MERRAQQATTAAASGRNSKVLLGWVRSQINLAPYDSDNNEALIVASGKANDSEEFDPFGVRLDLETMMYEQNASIDISEWKDRVGANGKRRRARKTTLAHVIKIVKGAGLVGITKDKIISPPS